jgi:RimJ/RimL family protein N-acetyltransferase
MSAPCPTLTRGAITLRPLVREDAPAFRALVDEESWAGMASPLPADDAAMAAHLGDLIDRPGSLCFAVERGGELVGRTTFYELVPGVRVEIGNTIYARAVWGSEVNPACKLLLFAHAFEELGLARVALRCDHRNTRSHRAIARLGAQFEGTLRAFRPAADGTIADVDYFSVLAGEWPAVRAGLEARLSA